MSTFDKAFVLTVIIFSAFCSASIATYTNKVFVCKQLNAQYVDSINACVNYTVVKGKLDE